MDEMPALTADDGAIRRALKDAHIPALMVTLVHLTGKTDILHGDIKPVTAPLSDSEDGLTEEERDKVRKIAFEALVDYRDRGRTLPPPPSAETVREMITFLTGLPVPDGYMPLLEEELSLHGEDGRAVPINGAVSPEQKETFQVLIIGAGMSGILAAIRLKQQGIPFLIVDKNEKLGGTWWENTYPGCRVDSPNHLYCYLFERKDDWPGYCSTRETLFDYFQHCAARYGLKPHIRLSTHVESATFDEETATWSVAVVGPDGPETLTANAVISAVGQLNIPKTPDVPGIERFKGVMFHSAAWEHEHDLRGKRVAIVGTGASATQFVPEIAGQPAHMYVFQRSAPWLLPSPDYHEEVSDGQQFLFKHVPYYARWFRLWLFRRDAADGALPFLFADPSWTDRSRAVSPDNDLLRQELINYIAEQVGDDSDLLAAATPDYPPGGKRPLRDCGVWLSTLKRDDCDLIASPVAEITATGLATEDGRSFDVDVIIFGTGFRADHFLWPMKITGIGGKTLNEEWASGPRAYKGMTVPGFPNLFCLYGPNTNIVVGSSIIFFSECEMRYIMGCLKLLFEGGHAAMNCKRDVHEAYNVHIDALNQETAWGAPGVRSWYKDASGRVTQNWPGTHLEFWETTKAPDPADFDFIDRG